MSPAAALALYVAVGAALLCVLPAFIPSRYDHGDEL
jgi:hypothetical protein